MDLTNVPVWVPIVAILGAIATGGTLSFKRSRKDKSREEETSINLTFRGWGRRWSRRRTTQADTPKTAAGGTPVPQDKDAA